MRRTGITRAAWVLGFTTTAGVAGASLSSDFAVVAGRGLSTGGSVQIGGSVAAMRDIWLGNHTQVQGSVYSFQAVGLDHHISITGDVGAGASLNIGNHTSVAGSGAYGSSYWVHNTGNVGGGVAQGPVAWDGQLPTAPAMASSEWAHEWYGNGTQLDLAPGDYGSLSMSRDGVIRLTAGTYNFRSIWVDRNVRFIADTSAGDVTINVVGDFSSGRDIRLERNGNSWLTLNTGGSLYMDRGSTADASINAFGGNLTLSRDVQVTGQVYGARDVWLDQGVAVSGMAAPSGGGGGGVPEPASLALIWTAAPLLLLRRR